MCSNFAASAICWNFNFSSKGSLCHISPTCLDTSLLDIPSFFATISGCLERRYKIKAFGGLGGFFGFWALATDPRGGVGAADRAKTKCGNRTSEGEELFD